MNTVDSSDAIEGFTVADEIGIDRTDYHDQSIPFDTTDLENDIRSMDNQSVIPADAPAFMYYNEADFDVGPLAQFRESITDAYIHPGASLPVTPPSHNNGSEQH